MARIDSTGRLVEEIEVCRQDDNPDCDHIIDEDTAEILSATDEAIEIGAECARCGGEFYAAPDVGTLSLHAKEVLAE